MATHVLAMEVHARLPTCRSLKQKRAVLRPVLDGLRHRFEVSAAETAHHDAWQRVTLAVAVVSSTAGHAGERMDGIERFIWSRPDLEVTSCERHWLELDR